MRWPRVTGKTPSRSRSGGRTLGSLRRRTTQNNPHGFNAPALRWDRGPAKLIAKYRLDLGGKIRLRPRLEWDRPALYRLVLRTAVKPWLGDTVSMRVTRGGAAAVVVTGAVQGGSGQSTRCITARIGDAAGKKAGFTAGAGTYTPAARDGAAAAAVEVIELWNPDVPLQQVEAAGTDARDARATAKPRLVGDCDELFLFVAEKRAHVAELARAAKQPWSAADEGAGENDRALRVRALLNRLRTGTVSQSAIFNVPKSLVEELLPRSDKRRREGGAEGGGGSPRKAPMHAAGLAGTMGRALHHAAAQVLGAGTGEGAGAGAGAGAGTSKEALLSFCTELQRQMPGACRALSLAAAKFTVGQCSDCPVDVDRCAFARMMVYTLASREPADANAADQLAASLREAAVATQRSVPTPLGSPTSTTTGSSGSYHEGSQGAGAGSLPFVSPTKGLLLAKLMRMTANSTVAFAAAQEAIGLMLAEALKADAPAVARAASLTPARDQSHSMQQLGQEARAHGAPRRHAASPLVHPLPTRSSRWESSSPPPTPRRCPCCTSSLPQAAYEGIKEGFEEALAFSLVNVMTRDLYTTCFRPMINGCLGTALGASRDLAPTWSRLKTVYALLVQDFVDALHGGPGGAGATDSSLCVSARLALMIPLHLDLPSRRKALRAELHNEPLRREEVAEAVSSELWVVTVERPVAAPVPEGKTAEHQAARLGVRDLVRAGDRFTLSGGAEQAVEVWSVAAASGDDSAERGMLLIVAEHSMVAGQWLCRGAEQVLKVCAVVRRSFDPLEFLRPTLHRDGARRAEWVAVNDGAEMVRQAKSQHMLMQTMVGLHLLQLGLPHVWQAMMVSALYWGGDKLPDFLKSMDPTAIGELEVLYEGYEQTHHDTHRALIVKAAADARSRTRSGRGGGGAGATGTRPPHGCLPPGRRAPLFLVCDGTRSFAFANNTSLDLVDNWQQLTNNTRAI